jgi:hypothetical protein
MRRALGTTGPAPKGWSDVDLPGNRPHFHHLAHMFTDVSWGDLTVHEPPEDRTMLSMMASAIATHCGAPVSHTSSALRQAWNMW